MFALSASKAGTTRAWKRKHVACLDRSHSDGPHMLRVDTAIKMAWRLFRDKGSCRGRQRLRTRDVVRRYLEVADVVEGVAKVKNERRGEESWFWSSASKRDNKTNHVLLKSRISRQWLTQNLF